MPSIAFEKFVANQKDVQLLWHAHREMLGDSSKLNDKAEVINRATIVFITAIWESYVEDVTREAFEILVDAPLSSSAMPNLVKSKLIDAVIQTNNKMDVWKIAGDGWKSLLEEHKEKILSDRIESFHSPKSDKVRDLLRDLLGIRNITQFWGESQETSIPNSEALDSYISMRGDIAHRLRTSRKIRKKDAKNYLALITELCQITDREVGRHIQSTTGSHPWIAATVDL